MPLVHLSFCILRLSFRTQSAFCLGHTTSVFVDTRHAVSWQLPHIGRGQVDGCGVRVQVVTAMTFDELFSGAFDTSPESEQGTDSDEEEAADPEEAAPDKCARLMHVLVASPYTCVCTLRGFESRTLDSLNAWLCWQGVPACRAGLTSQGV